MVLVKKKHLYILTAIFCVILILGEVRFFMALKAMEKVKDLDLKFQFENFIFASIVLVLLLVCFIIYFMRASSNVLKKMDRMIELSEYGKLDISPHLEQMGQLGEKVGYLLYHLQTLNTMKSLKISSVSNINGFLIDRSDENILLTDVRGDVINCSAGAVKVFNADKKKIRSRNVHDLIENIDFSHIYYDLEKKRRHVDIKKFKLRSGNKEKEFKFVFIPVRNAEDKISNIMVVVEEDNGE